MEKIERSWLEGQKSYQKWFEQLEFYSNKKQISYSMKTSYTSILRNFVRFLRSGEDKEASPDSIIEWAKNVKDLMEIVKLHGQFSLWLQGNEVLGYDKRVSKKNKYPSERTADNTAHGQIRGFFIHNGIMLPKSGRKKMSSRSKAKKNDENYSIFKASESGREVADYGLFKQFLATLNIHDQTAIMCILSSSQDPGDVLSLNVGFVLDRMNDERFYWEGKRNKTQEDFRTFFSKETTTMIKRYIAQERKGAERDDPLFSRTKGRRLSVNNLSSNCKYVAEKMGLINGNPQNPFRPKRMRSIFRSACSIAKIEKGYSNVFMGHKTDVSDSYLEKPRATLELQYRLIEPFLTVYSGEINEDVEELKDANRRLSNMVGGLAEKLGRYEGILERIEEIEEYINIGTIRKELKNID